MKSTRAKRTSHHQTDRRGVAIIEFAVVAPLLFLFLFAAMEFSHLTTLRNTANNAAYEAARVAVVPGANKTEAEREANKILSIVGLREYDLTVSDITEDSTEVTVTINIPYAKNALMVPWFTGGVKIHSQSTLQTERYAGIPTAP